MTPTPMPAPDSAVGTKAAGPSTKVLIVDDHAMVAEGFARIISGQPDFKLVGVAGTVADAMRLIEQEAPDVILMDYNLPDGDGAHATIEIRRLWPDSKVLMLSGSEERDVLSRSMEAGCSGFLAKNRQASDVIGAVRAVARGELVMRSNELAGLLVHSQGPANGEGLSPREMEVLRMLAKGQSTEAIATELFLSVHTVRNHVRSILMKLSAHSKLEAVAIATRNGLIGLDEMGQ